MLLLTVLPADGRGVPKQVVAWRTGELGQSSDTVTRPSQAGAHKALLDCEAGALSLSDGQEESVGVAALTGAPELPAVLHRHVLQLQPVHPVVVWAGWGPPGGEVPSGVVPGPLGSPTAPPEDAVEDQPGPGGDHHLPTSPQHLGPPRHSPLYPGREALWAE